MLILVFLPWRSSPARLSFTSVECNLLTLTNMRSIQKIAKDYQVHVVPDLIVPPPNGMFAVPRPTERPSLGIPALRFISYSFHSQFQASSLTRSSSISRNPSPSSHSSSFFAVPCPTRARPGWVMGRWRETLGIYPRFCITLPPLPASSLNGL